MSLDVVGAVGASSEVRRVELDLVPAAVQAHRQHAAERMDASCALVVAGAETTSNVLVIEDLHKFISQSINQSINLYQVFRSCRTEAVEQPPALRRQTLTSDTRSFSR